MAEGNHTGFYVLIFVGLLVLTALTAGAAYLPLGPFGLPVALAIAGAKVFLVAHYFMHLREADGLTRAYAWSGLVWLVLLIGFTLADVMTRGWVYR